MKVLLTTDFKKSSANAADYAIQLFSSDPQWHDKVSFHLVHIFQMPMPYSGFGTTPASTIEDLEKSARSQLQKELDRLKTKTDSIKSYFEIGAKQESIKAFVEDEKIDMIVMGTKEKDLLDRITLGSTAADVSTHVACPVLVIPKNTTFRAPKKIAFGSDYQAMNIPREAFGILKHLLKTHDAYLQVFHVYEGGDPEALKREMEKNVQHYFLEKVNHEFYPIVNSHIGEGVDEFLENQKPDMITLIPRERGFVRSLFHSSVTRRMVYEAKTPILILR
ncbi:MAG: universal stress protein [Cyclobacteriaceae bacterium]|nr:universal stress protein [Cyclobacteriaceae bacterium HetDA_MAG_MS6]